MNKEEKNRKITIRIEHGTNHKISCPVCSAEAKTHDHRVNFKLSWDEVDGIMQRVVKRGLARREKQAVQNMGIDETSYQKRHEYVTVLQDKDRGSVIDVLDGRKAETLEKWLKTQEKVDLSGVKSVSMDMWDPYIKAVKAAFAEAEKIIVFDRFHVSKHLNDALDKVRRREHRTFMQEAGESPLSKSRFQWLRACSVSP